MFSHFFIERPIFAAVLSIVITLAGLVALFNLPVAQYPQITPPSIMVMCNYPGADARVVAIYSPRGRYDQLYLSNYATIKLKDELARVDGVGDVGQFGQQDYSMRLWVDPERLAALNLTASDVANAVREQNRQVAAGHF